MKEFVNARFRHIVLAAAMLGFGAAYADGVVFKGASNGGIDTHLKISTTDFTFETWVRPTSLGGKVEGHVAGQYVGKAAQPDFGLFIVTNIENGVNVYRPAVYWRLSAAGAGDFKMAPSNAYTPIGVWTHVAVVREDTTLTLYVDGFAAAVTNVPANVMPPQSKNLILGGLKGNSGTGLVGSMCDARLWRTARTIGDIRANMGRRLTGGEEGLVGYWPLSDGSGTTAANLVAGTQAGTIQTGSWLTLPYVPFPPDGYSYQTNSSSVAVFGNGSGTPFDAHIRMPTQQFTVEAWTRPDVVTGKEENVFLGVYSGLALPGDFAMRAKNRKATMFLRGSNEEVVNAVASSQNILASNWVHTAATFDGSQMKIYVDGRLDGTVTCTNSTLKPTQVANFILGGLRTSSNVFRGRVCDVRYWGKVRTEEEIFADMGTRLTGTEDGLLGYWPMNETGGGFARNLGALATDACSTGAIRVVDGTSPYHEYAISNKVYSSSGADKGVNSQCQIMTTAFTMEAWVNPADVSSENDIMSQYFGNAQTNDLIFNVQKGGQARCFFRNFSGALLSTQQVPVGRWTHIAATCDGDTMSLYLNGALDATATRTALAPLVPHNGPIVICGLKANNNTPFRGMLSDLRVWSRARSAEEIGNDFMRRLTGTEAGLVGYWPMDGGGDATKIESIAYPRIRQASLLGTWVVPTRPFPFVGSGTMLIFR